MKRILPLILLIAIGLSSCSSSKHQTTSRAEHSKNKKSSSNNISQKVVTNAKAYEGVKYKTGGTTKKGMDCSGLVYTSFLEANISLPRVSRDMATRGSKISITDVREGDLLFFKTSKKKRGSINHVGLVVTSRTGRVEFIHSTTSKGVIISSLAEQYWHYAFVEARRVL
ncbi:C40 family peptidase [Mangrovimonas aestuarii]|uniref:C40 family peptidase n=1 Tax=Mangrovimonas aestuarii TaxID=3018443 RepID=UPI0023792ECD|nr:C40 family peptidase [Mangrovimonas aestuarii]